jgi:hypothetical protein
MPTGGTLQNLAVATNSSLGIPITVTVYVDGNATTLTCTFSANGCSDTSHTWMVNPGDTVVVVASTTGSVSTGTLTIRAAWEKQ